MNEQKEYKPLDVTNVQIFTFKKGVGKIKALSHIVLNDQIAIRDLRVIDGEHGLFVGYPQNPFYNGDNETFVVAPITRQLREKIENAVLEAYKRNIENVEG